MSGFFDISAPPQSLESLDVWGALDSLPASLDSELWRRAGLYGLRIAEVARASGRVSASRTACLAGRLRAASGGSLRSLVELDLRSEGRSGGGLSLNFGLPQALGGGARTGGLLVLRFKGWDWKAAPLAVQNWTAPAHITALWHEPESERRSAWR